MAKTDPEDVESGDAATDLDDGAGDTLEEDKTRCGKCQNSCWSFLISCCVLAALFCFASPSRFYESSDVDMPATTCGNKACTTKTDLMEFNTIWSSKPGWDLGQHYKMFYNNFDFTFHCKWRGETPADIKPDLWQYRCGIISMDVLTLWASTLWALPYFFLFTFFPGWAYKIYFKGTGVFKCSKKLACKKLKCDKLKCCQPQLVVPCTCCGKLAAAPNEQNHQADQLSRLVGLFIGLAFGGPLFYSRFGARGGMALDDALMMNLANWTLVFVYHVSAIVNKAAPRLFSLYQAVYTLAIMFLIFLSFPTSWWHLEFTFEEKFNDYYVEYVTGY